MTREEAIDNLKRHRARHFSDFGWDNSTLDALDIAIQALEAIDNTKEEIEAIENFYKFTFG